MNKYVLKEILLLLFFLFDKITLQHCESYRILIGHLRRSIASPTPFNANLILIIL